MKNIVPKYSAKRQDKNRLVKYYRNCAKLIENINLAVCCLI